MLSRTISVSFVFPVLATLFMMNMIFFLSSVTALTFDEGDTCGVTSKNFLEAEFLGNYRVAGSEGCALRNSTQPCYCAPNLADATSLSEWKWQCGEDVQFGPKNGKVCPTTVPVLKKYGVDSISFSEAMLGVAVECDPTVHPTGYPDDEVCGYSECENGGEYSAICACVSLDDRGVENGGNQWFCLHSTCDCRPNESSASVVTMTSLYALVASMALITVANIAL